MSLATWEIILMVVVWSLIPLAIWIGKKQDKRLEKFRKKDEEAIQEWLRSQRK